MTSPDARRVLAGLILAVFLAVTQVAAQRGSEPVTAKAGATSGPVSSDAITPFTIRVPDAVLTDLKQRLSRARFGDEIPGVGWEYGTNRAYLMALVEYWRDKFDWRAQERRLNQFAQFTTNIDGLDIHFVHQRSKIPNALPLLLLNGWPSSIAEYEKVIGPLTDPVAHGGRAEDAYHVVIPVMPGYGFSDKPRTRGYNPERIADMWAKLMARLGYARYATHGSDRGIAVGTHLAIRDASHMAVLHLTGCTTGAPQASSSTTAVQSPPPVSSNLGYQEIQSTKPQAVGHGLADSPIGLAAWIIDKWYSWTDHDGNLEQTYTKDELLTNITIYWITNTGTSSAWLYYETRHFDGQLLPSLTSRFLPPLPAGRVQVPTGCGLFPSQYDRRGIATSPNATPTREAAALRYNIVHFATMPRGGHFPALEQPKLWLDDLRGFLQAHR